MIAQGEGITVATWADVFELPLKLSVPDYVALQHKRG
jgi:hypothetical protein